MTFLLFTRCDDYVISSLISVPSQCINKKQQVGFELGFKTNIFFNVLHICFNPSLVLWFNHPFASSFTLLYGCICRIWFRTSCNCVLLLNAARTFINELILTPFAYEHRREKIFLNFPRFAPDHGRCSSMTFRISQISLYLIRALNIFLKMKIKQILHMPNLFNNF